MLTEIQKKKKKKKKKKEKKTHKKRKKKKVWGIKEGRLEKLVKGLKRSRSWGCTVQHRDYHQQHSNDCSDRWLQDSL